MQSSSHRSVRANAEPSCPALPSAPCVGPRAQSGRALAAASCRSCTPWLFCWDFIPLFVELGHVDSLHCNLWLIFGSVCWMGSTELSLMGLQVHLLNFSSSLQPGRWARRAGASGSVLSSCPPPKCPSGPSLSPGELLQVLNPANTALLPSCFPC